MDGCDNIGLVHIPGLGGELRWLMIKEAWSRESQALDTVKDREECFSSRIINLNRELDQYVRSSEN